MTRRATHRVFSCPFFNLLSSLYNDLVYKSFLFSFFNIFFSLFLGGGFLHLNIASIGRVLELGHLRFLKQFIHRLEIRSETSLADLSLLD